MTTRRDFLRLVASAPVAALPVPAIAPAMITPLSGEHFPLKIVPAMYASGLVGYYSGFSMYELHSQQIIEAFYGQVID